MHTHAATPHRCASPTLAARRTPLSALLPLPSSLHSFLPPSFLLAGCDGSPLVFFNTDHTSQRAKK